MSDSYLSFPDLLLHTLTPPNRPVLLTMEHQHRQMLGWETLPIIVYPSGIITDLKCHECNHAIEPIHVPLHIYLPQSLLFPYVTTINERVFWDTTDAQKNSESWSTCSIWETSCCCTLRCWCLLGWYTELDSPDLLHHTAVCVCVCVRDNTLAPLQTRTPRPGPSDEWSG